MKKGSNGVSEWTINQGTMILKVYSKGTITITEERVGAKCFSYIEKFLNSEDYQEAKDLYESISFLLLAPHYGLQREYLNKSLIFEGRPWKVVSINPKNRKYPVILQHKHSSDRMKATASWVESKINL